MTNSNELLQLQNKIRVIRDELRLITRIPNEIQGCKMVLQLYKDHYQAI